MVQRMWKRPVMATRALSAAAFWRGEGDLKDGQFISLGIKFPPQFSLSRKKYSASTPIIFKNFSSKKKKWSSQFVKKMESYDKNLTIYDWAHNIENTKT